MTRPRLPILGPAQLAAVRRARVAWLREELARLPTPYHGDTADDRIANRRRHEAALDDLTVRLMAQDDAPRLRSTWQGARVEMLGITTTSTGGMAAALRNWITRTEGGNA